MIRIISAFYFPPPLRRGWTKIKKEDYKYFRFGNIKYIDEDTGVVSVIKVKFADFNYMTFRANAVKNWRRKLKKKYKILRGKSYLMNQIFSKTNGVVFNKNGEGRKLVNIFPCKGNLFLNLEDIYL